MATNGKAADDGRVTDLANTVDDRLEEARGFGVFRKWWPGWYYGPPAGNYSTNSTNVGQKIQYWVPVWVPETVDVDRICVEITTGVGAGPTVTLAIYDSTADDAPGNLVLNAGTIDPTSPGVKEITIDQTLTRGMWWLSMHTNEKITYRAIVGTLPGVPSKAGGSYFSMVSNTLLRTSQPLFSPAPAYSTMSNTTFTPLLQVRAKV